MEQVRKSDWMKAVCGCLSVLAASCGNMGPATAPPDQVTVNVPTFEEIRTVPSSEISYPVISPVTGLADGDVYVFPIIVNGKVTDYTFTFDSKVGETGGFRSESSETLVSTSGELTLTRVTGAPLNVIVAEADVDPKDFVRMFPPGPDCGEEEVEDIWLYPDDPWDGTYICDYVGCYSQSGGASYPIEEYACDPDGCSANGGTEIWDCHGIAD